MLSEQAFSRRANRVPSCDHPHVQPLSDDRGAVSCRPARRIRAARKTRPKPQQVPTAGKKVSSRRFLTRRWRMASIVPWVACQSSLAMRSGGMRFVILSGVFLLAVSCSSVVEPVPVAVSASPSPALPAAPPQQIGPTRPLIQPAASLPAAQPKVTRGDFSGIVFEGVAFDSRSHRLVVVDQAGGPGSTFLDAAGAAASVQGVAAVNGGFFTPEGEPLGLVMAAGNRAGAWNSASSLGSGVWYDSGATAICRREKLGRAGALSMRELLQAGPMLVDGGQVVTGLDAVKVSARTMILWDGGSRWWIGRCTPASLARTAAALGGAGVPGWQVRHALNLDGGRSSELWVSGEISGGPIVRRSPWNRPVRNFLVLARASGE